MFLLSEFPIQNHDGWAPNNKAVAKMASGLGSLGTPQTMTMAAVTVDELIE